MPIYHSFAEMPHDVRQEFMESGILDRLAIRPFTWTELEIPLSSHFGGDPQATKLRLQYLAPARDKLIASGKIVESEGVFSLLVPRTPALPEGKCMCGAAKAHAPGHSSWCPAA